MIKNSEGQVSMLDLDSQFLKMFAEHCQVVGGAISERSCNRSSISTDATSLYLDLRMENGLIQGPWWTERQERACVGESMTYNFGVAPNAGEECTLSAILEVPTQENSYLSKYLLSKTACLGILSRASKRGKTLPTMLKEALEEVAYA